MKMTLTEYCDKKKGLSKYSRRYLQRLLADGGKKELLNKTWGITSAIQVGRAHLLNVRNDYDFGNNE